MAKNLVKIIQNNPGCKAVIDNDYWILEDVDGNEIAQACDVLEPFQNTTYQDNNCYGGAILLALAEIAGIKIESV